MFVRLVPTKTRLLPKKMERSNVINLLGYWSGVDENVKTVRTFEGCPIFLIDIHCSQLTYALQVNSSLESVGKTAHVLAFFLLTFTLYN